MGFYSDSRGQMVFTALPPEIAVNFNGWADEGEIWEAVVTDGSGYPRFYRKVVAYSRNLDRMSAQGIGGSLTKSSTAWVETLDDVTCTY